MQSDIKLQDNKLIFDSDYAVFHASDIVLDAPARHKGRGTARRALVHDHEDGLTVNYGGDYPGGVKLVGAVSVRGALDVEDSVTINGHLVAKLEQRPNGLHLLMGGGSDVNVVRVPCKGLCVEGILQVDQVAYIHDVAVGSLRPEKRSGSKRAGIDLADGVSVVNPDVGSKGTHGIEALPLDDGPVLLSGVVAELRREIAVLRDRLDKVEKKGGH